MQLDRNDEPFLQLPVPHSHLRITPIRYSDGDVSIATFNDPRVYMFLRAPPFPFTQQDWDDRFRSRSAATAEKIAEWKEVEERRKSGAGGGSLFVGKGMPVSAIRDVNPETLEERFLGEINVKRQQYLGIRNEAKRKRVKAENDAREPGDPGIQWEISFYLSPSTHSQGIMTAVLGAVINTFLIPYMNIHHLMGVYLENNIGSRRVLEKNGFFFERFEPNIIELAESKTRVKNRTVGIGILRWEIQGHHDLGKPRN